MPPAPQDLDGLTLGLRYVVPRGAPESDVDGTLRLRFSGSFLAHPPDLVEVQVAVGPRRGLLVRRWRGPPGPEPHPPRFLDVGARVNLDPDNFQAEIDEQMWREDAAALAAAAVARWHAWLIKVTVYACSLASALLACYSTYQSVVAMRTPHYAGPAMPGHDIPGHLQGNGSDVSSSLLPVDDMGAAIAYSMTIAVHAFMHDIVQPYSLLLDIYGTHTFGRRDPGVDVPMDTLMEEFSTAISLACFFLTGQYILGTVRPTDEWMHIVQPLCNTSTMDSFQAAMTHSFLQESLTGSARPDFEGLFHVHARVSETFVRNLRNLAAHMGELAVQDRWRLGTREERNTMFCAVIRYYLTPGIVDGLYGEYHMRYGLLLDPLVDVREDLDVLLARTRTALHIVESELLPRSVSRNETLGMVLEVLLSEAEEPLLGVFRASRTGWELDKYRRDGDRAVSELRRTVPLAKAVEAAAAKARDALNAAIRVGADIATRLAKLEEAGWVEFREESEGRTRRVPVTADPEALGAAAERLLDELAVWVKSAMEQQWKREGEGGLDGPNLVLADEIQLD